MPEKIRRLRVGITGATGGLGRQFAASLARQGCRIRCLVREGREPGDLLSLGNVEIVRGELGDARALQSFVQDLDVCFHLAAEVMAPDRETLFRTNVEGTRLLCQALADQAPFCRLVYCSSIVVHDVRWWNRWLLSDYTLSKYEAERVVSHYESERGLWAVIIQPGYIYGPGDTKFLPALTGMMRKGLPWLVRGGERFAPVVHMEDLCDLLQRAGTHVHAVGRRYAAIHRHPIGIHGLLRQVAKTMGYTYPTAKVPKAPLVLMAFLWRLFARLTGGKKRPPLDMRTISLLSKRGRVFDDAARYELGWKPVRSLEEGLKDALAWLRGEGEEAESSLALEVCPIPERGGDGRPVA